MKEEFAPFLSAVIPPLLKRLEWTKNDENAADEVEDDDSDDEDDVRGIVCSDNYIRGYDGITIDSWSCASVADTRSIIEKHI
jgi:hypothetical protein